MLAFSQPVFDMQRVFRVVLDAMSRPARLCRLPVFPQSVPDGLSPVLAALALTLCDGESPLWLSPGLRKDETTTWLRFHCGCPIVEEADKAAFALVADASELPPLSAFAQGVPAYPDRSATVLLAGPHSAAVPETHQKPSAVTCLPSFSAYKAFLWLFSYESQQFRRQPVCNLRKICIQLFPDLNGNFSVCQFNHICLERRC